MFVIYQNWVLLYYVIVLFYALSINKKFFAFSFNRILFLWNFRIYLKHLKSKHFYSFFLENEFQYFWIWFPHNILCPFNSLPINHPEKVLDSSMFKFQDPARFSESPGQYIRMGGGASAGQITKLWRKMGEEEKK